jgi:excisionase family DNA binding protein
LLGVSTPTLYRNWREWGMRAYRIGYSLKFRERDIESFLRHNEA